MVRHWTTWAAAVIVVVLGLLMNANPSVQAASKPNKTETSKTMALKVTVRVNQSAEFISTLDIHSRDFARAVQKASTEHAAEAAILPDIEIELRQGTKSLSYRLEETGHLWNETTMTRHVLPPKFAEQLLHLTESLRTQHYGSMLSWSSVKQLLPKKSIFKVIDLESGLAFQVQRRAGSDHADVQPLTKEDSRIMKQIYNDKWSWKRKAVLVRSEHEWIAASMNGMPHGGDGIPDNDFSGHFCIHFLDSSTHKSDSPDLAHQLMVHKAAGKLTPLFEESSPLLLAKMFIVLMNHHDEDMLRQITKGVSADKDAHIVRVLTSLESIREPKQKKYADNQQLVDEDLGEQLSAKVTLPVTIMSKDHSQRNTNYTFLFQRASKQMPWHLIDLAL